MQLLKNYQQDLLQSRKTPLLIELSKKDLNGLCKDDTCGVNISLALAKELYDTPLSNTSETNIIFIDADEASKHEHIYLLEKFLDLVSDQLKTIKNLAIVKEGISASLSAATGGLINNFAGEAVNKAVDVVFESVSSDITDLLIDVGLEHIDISGKIIASLKGEVFAFVNDKSINFLEKMKEHSLYLSAASKEAIKELSAEFKNSLTPAESFRLILKLILSVAIDMPTLLYIKNPHKLDRDSLAILSLLFSVSKEAKESNKHTNISVVYAYNDKEFQPYSDTKEEYLLSKTLLDEQRRYTQRYAMLERPTSDIPRIAVKSHMFVGRKEELAKLNARYFYSKEQTKVATLETISGEPGIGKTKLVRKHLEQIKKQEDKGAQLIQLTLLNQVGHSSSNTGLSSLTDSILKEASRLESLRSLEGLASKAVDYAINTLFNTIKSTLQVDTIINVGSAILDRTKLEPQLQQIKDNTAGDLDNKSQDDKQQQFLRLTDAIKKLEQFSKQSMPIVLFIDDLQWIDEDSSEYILEHFVKRFNVHMVATIRPSDATTILSKLCTNKEQNPYTIALLKKVDIKLKEEVPSEIDTSSVEFGETHLKGLNKEILTLLIAQVIQGDTTHQEVLAQTIIKQLNNDKTKDEVNTLFAVETLNMLCDEKLYATQEERIEQLILTELPLKFNSNIEDFSKALEETFEMLDKKHKKAFEHINWDESDTEQKFNLMAYAVLEERLSILKIYFKEHGNAAVNTLLFSSLLGTPFNSNIVKNVLESLATTEEELLQPLKKQILDTKSEISLTEVHYEIIEEVYEIVSRYRAFSSAYAYRHSLLNIFLEKQLEYLLKESSRESKDKLFKLILNEIKEEEQKQDFYGEYEQGLNTQEYENMLFFRTVEQNVLLMAYNENPSVWAKTYTTSLNNLATSYKNNNQISKAIELEEESLEILKVLYKENPSVLAEKYTTSLNNLAASYKNNNQIPKAIELEKESLEIRKTLYKENPSVWAEDYTTSLNNLAASYYNINQILKAIGLEEECLEILKALYIKNPPGWAEDYTRALNNLASFYKDNNQLSKAIDLEEESLTVRKTLYKKNPSVWAEEYTTALINLAVSYYNNKQISQAIELGKKSLEIRKTLYQENPSVWAENYTTVLNNLATFYGDNNQLTQAIELREETLEILKVLYQENQSVWVIFYTRALTNLSYSYERNNQLSKAIELEEESITIRKTLYQENPSVWAENYTRALSNLAFSYKDNNQISKAIELGEKSLKILKTLYQENPSVWAEDYNFGLYNVAQRYEELEDSLKASQLFNEELDVLKFLLSKDRERWIEDYKTTLHNLAHHLLKIKFYEPSAYYFKERFVLFDLNSISTCDEFFEYMYPFVKYYQATIYSNFQAIKLLEEDAFQAIKYLKYRFPDCYDEQIKELEEGYLPLQQSEDKFDNEKHMIFMKVFVREDI